MPKPITPPCPPVAARLQRSDLRNGGFNHMSTLDSGGTSTDLCLIEGGSRTH